MNLLGCERTGSDKRQNCCLSCRVKLFFRIINGNHRKCTHRTRATSDKIVACRNNASMKLKKKLSLENFCPMSLVSCGYTFCDIHYLILRKDSLTQHDKRQFCHLSLPVRWHPYMRPFKPNTDSLIFWVRTNLTTLCSAVHIVIKVLLTLYKKKMLWRCSYM